MVSKRLGKKNQFNIITITLRIVRMLIYQRWSDDHEMITAATTVARDHMFIILITMTVVLRVVMMSVAAASQVYNNAVVVAVMRSHRVLPHIHASHHGQQ